MSSSLDEAVSHCRKLYGHRNYVVYIEPCYKWETILMAINRNGWTKVVEDFKENTGKNYHFYVEGYQVHINTVKETVDKDR